MQHRHLVETDLPSSAAIDDTIERGSLDDWIILRDQAKADESVVRKILRVCAARCADPYAQRHHLWRLYAQQLASKIDQDRVAATPQWELPKIRHMGLKADPFATRTGVLKPTWGNEAMPAPVINRHNPDQWKADSEASVDYYNRSCKSASLRPLDALSCWLNNHGYSCVRPRSLDEMAPGEFASHVNVKGRGPSDDDRRGNIPVDFAIMPKTARKGSLPILIEAKTSDSFPFSNRGCRFAIAKAGKLKNILGRDVSLILHLAGYFDPGYLGRIASEGIDWVWQHRIGDFHKLLSNRSLN